MITEDESDHTSSESEGEQSTSSSESTEDSNTVSSPAMSDFTESSSSSFDPDDFLDHDDVTLEPALKTYKLVGDNVDKHVHPRDMRLDHQSRSFHYFQTYAVRDRVDLTDISDVKVIPDTKDIKLDLILPTSNDKKQLLSNYGILFTRVLKKCMPWFAKFATGLDRHIKHEFYEQMSRKSEVVSHTYASSIVRYWSL